MTAAILSPFQALVKDFKYRLPLQKADLMVGIIPLWLTGLIPLWPPRGQANGQSIHWASDYSPATVQDMGVNHGGTDVGVSEKLLNCANIVAIFQQMGGKGMAHGVRAGWLPDAPLEPPIFDGLLEDRFMEVVSALFPSESVDIINGFRTGASIVYSMLCEMGTCRLFVRQRVHRKNLSISLSVITSQALPPHYNPARRRQDRCGARSGRWPRASRPGAFQASTGRAGLRRASRRSQNE